jgi:hypothetical protein
MTYRERQRVADIQAAIDAIHSQLLDACRAAICPRNMRPDVHALCGEMSAFHAAN